MKPIMFPGSKNEMIKKSSATALKIIEMNGKITIVYFTFIFISIIMKNPIHQNREPKVSAIEFLIVKSDLSSKKRDNKKITEKVKSVIPNRNNFLPIMNSVY
jgi:hypothetical protein